MKVPEAIEYLAGYYGGETKSKHCTAIRLVLAELYRFARFQRQIENALDYGKVEVPIRVIERVEAVVNAETERNLKGK